MPPPPSAQAVLSTAEASSNLGVATSYGRNMLLCWERTAAASPSSPSPFEAGVLLAYSVCSAALMARLLQEPSASQGLGVVLSSVVCRLQQAVGLIPQSALTAEEHERNRLGSIFSFCYSEGTHALTPACPMSVHGLAGVRLGLKPLLSCCLGTCSRPSLLHDHDFSCISSAPIYTHCAAPAPTWPAPFALGQPFCLQQHPAQSQR